MEIRDTTSRVEHRQVSADAAMSYGMEFGVLDVDWAANAQTALDTAVHQAFGRDVETINVRVLRGHPADALVTAAAGADLLARTSAQGVGGNLFRAVHRADLRQSGPTR